MTTRELIVALTDADPSGNLMVVKTGKYSDYTVTGAVVGIVTVLDGEPEEHSLGIGLRAVLITG